MNETNDGTKTKAKYDCSIKRAILAGLWGVCVLAMLPTLGNAGTLLIGLPAMSAPWVWWWHKDGSVKFDHFADVAIAMFIGSLGTLVCVIPFLIMKSCAH